MGLLGWRCHPLTGIEEVGRPRHALCPGEVTNATKHACRCMSRQVFAGAAYLLMWKFVLAFSPWHFSAATSCASAASSSVEYLQIKPHMRSQPRAHNRVTHCAIMPQVSRMHEGTLIGGMHIKQQGISPSQVCLLAVLSHPHMCLPATAPAMFCHTLFQPH